MADTDPRQAPSKDRSRHYTWMPEDVTVEPPSTPAPVDDESAA